MDEELRSFLRQMRDSLLHIERILEEQQASLREAQKKSCQAESLLAESLSFLPAALKEKMSFLKPDGKTG